jgi:predicted ATPase/DNA-binding SARP family transcriptional activator
MTTSVVAVRMQLLGGVRAFIEGQEVTFSGDKRHQLLAYLAYTNDWVNRDKLANLFYSDTTEVARQNLRRLLQRVQDLDWLEHLEIERTRIRWEVETDYSVFRKALEENDVDKALNVYTGSFLKGLESYEDNEFATWLELERERLHGEWRSVVFKKSNTLKAHRSYAQASSLLRKLLEQDEFDEEALLMLLHVLHADGQSQGALRTYQIFAERLKREMGLTPSFATEQFGEVLEGQKTVQLSLKPIIEEPKVFLPIPATSFIGRELELSEIVSLLAEKEVRLLTLLGPGGVGKTRTALQVAKELLNRYQDGVHFVSLESSTSANAIPLAITETLAVPLQGQDEPLQRVIGFLKAKNLLLVLDNFEHLVEGAIVVSNLIRACPQLDILVTSRERLNLDEEHVLSLEGLAVPQNNASLEDALSYDAVTLFVERAKRVRSSFTLTKEELPSVLEICHIVQGFPLGIELASVWVKLMSCREIAEEIQKSLDFLESTSRNAVERHRSIRATFEYSWKLLSPREQEVLKKLSVFQGGFTREAASFVAGANSAVLAALVDKSLLRVFEGRYDFHPLLQNYGREKLAESPRDESQTTEKHAQFFLSLVETTNLHVHGPKETEWLTRLDQDYDNVRAALEGAGTGTNLDATLRLVSGLRHFWRYRGYYDEARNWTAKVLSTPTTASIETLPRAKTLMTAGLFALFQGDYAVARKYYEESLVISRALESTLDTAAAFINLGIISIDQGDEEQAKYYYQEALALAREIGDEDLEYRALTNLGVIATNRGEHQQAKVLYEDGLRLVREMGNKRELAVSLDNLGITAWQLGDFSKAKTLFEESLGIGRELQSHHDVAVTLSNLGAVALDQEDEELAYRCYQESFELRLKLNDKWGIAFSFENLASYAVVQGEFEKAACLWGAAESLREKMNAPIPPNWQPRYEKFVAIARGKLGPAIFEARWQEGRKMGLEQSVRYALAE